MKAQLKQVMYFPGKLMLQKGEIFKVRKCDGYMLMIVNEYSAVKIPQKEVKGILKFIE